MERARRRTVEEVASAYRAHFSTSRSLVGLSFEELTILPRAGPGGGGGRYTNTGHARVPTPKILEQITETVADPHEWLTSLFQQSLSYVNAKVPQISSSSDCVNFQLCQEDSTGAEGGLMLLRSCSDSRRCLR